MAGSLMHFNPFNKLRRADPFRNMEEFFRDFSMMPSLSEMASAPQIRMDVEETESGYKVKAEIPGVRKEDIKVAIEGNEISISAETRTEEDKKTGNMMCSERYYGQQYRSFILPQEVDDGKVEAKYLDGILELTLPKKPGTAKKQIDIH